MRYILDTREYKDLIDAATKLSSDTTNLIMRLCMDVANHKPIVNKEFRDRTPRPWGCWKSEDRPGTNIRCDLCPVNKDCPEPNKRWNKGFNEVS